MVFLSKSDTEQNKHAEWLYKAIFLKRKMLKNWKNIYTRTYISVWQKESVKWALFV